MIRYLRLQNYKIIKNLQMEDLGQINVICGKNNSGKTTIFEAMIKPKHSIIGKLVEEVDWIEEIFLNIIAGYSNLDINFTKDWFRLVINDLSAEKTIWWVNDKAKIVQNLITKQKESQYLRRFNLGNEFDGVFEKYFEKSINEYKPAIVPPKRHLEFQTGINLNSEIEMAGEGILNQVFYLKNQDPESSEYKRYLSILEKFECITGARFNIVISKENQIKLVYKNRETWVDAVDSGLGLTDVFIIVSLLHLLESTIFLIEEPENHLHAEFQKKLLAYLKTVKNKQFFISTHSSIFLDPNLVDKIFYCQNKGEISLTDQTSKSKIIDSLGYSITENLTSDLLILLEGSSDKPIIQKILSWNNLTEPFNIKFWPLGGDNMANLDLSVFAERNNVFALVDSDPGSQTIRTKFLRNCYSNNIFAQQLSRYSIENYFTIDAIKQVFPEQIKKSLKSLDPNESVDIQIGFKSKGVEGGRSIKSKNGEIISKMKPEDIEGTDLQDFVVHIINFLNTKL